MTVVQLPSSGSTDSLGVASSNQDTFPDPDSRYCESPGPDLSSTFDAALKEASKAPPRSQRDVRTLCTKVIAADPTIAPLARGFFVTPLMEQVIDALLSCPKLPQASQVEKTA